MSESIQRARARGISSLKLGMSVFMISTLSYYAVGCFIGMNAGFGKSLFSTEDDEWAFIECAYATAITLTTVGYTDLLGTEKAIMYYAEVEVDGHKTRVYRMESNMAGWEDENWPEGVDGELYYNYTNITSILTVLQVVVGITFFLYVIAQVTAFFVEGEYDELVSYQQMKKAVKSFDKHYILIGGGDTGFQTAKQFLEDGVDFVVVDPEKDIQEKINNAIREMRKSHRKVKLPVFLRGDALEDETLLEAGVDRAAGIASVLPSTRDNLVVIVTARQITKESNPELKIVSRALDLGEFPKLFKAGADKVVSPSFLGGLRIASASIRPSVVDFLDLFLIPGFQKEYKFEGVEVKSGSPAENKTIAECGIETAAGVSIIALRHKGSDEFVYNPSGSEKLEAGTTVAFFATESQKSKIKNIVGA
ncbi:MAG: NAD-binding protein [Planctomycetes bacterium]|nr:NAD-binding protein [Planctomycetota bacterium]